MVAQAKAAHRPAIVSNRRDMFNPLKNLDISNCRSITLTDPSVPRDRNLVRDRNCDSGKATISAKRLLPNDHRDSDYRVANHLPPHPRIDVRLSENGSELQISRSVRERNRITGIHDAAVGAIPDIAGASVIPTSIVSVAVVPTRIVATAVATASIAATTVSAATTRIAATAISATTAVTTAVAATVAAAARPATRFGFGSKHAQTGQRSTHTCNCHDPAKHLYSP